MHVTDKIYIAGHTGLVGAALIRRLARDGYNNLCLRSHQELDLREQAAVRAFFAQEKPDYVFLAAGKVGGIQANSRYPAPFLYDNMLIAANVIDAAWQHGVKKLLFLGSSCIYPRLCPQPIREEYLLSSALEPTNAPYALAKIAGVMLCHSYHTQYGFQAISAMPTNLYGPGDRFHPENSHVIPALIQRFHEALRTRASEMTLWGTGAPRREFMHVDDLADALLFLMRHYDQPQHINVGVGHDMSIAELGTLLATITGFKGRILFDSSRPDGTPQKLLDVHALHALGWKASIPIEQGLRETWQWYCENQK